MRVDPLEIAVIPRGVRFRVELPDALARGYVCENFGAPLRLPDLGPIGSNGLAMRARLSDAGRLVRGSGRALSSWWRSSRAGSGRRRSDHSPFDVVAWRGNHAPYKYDLRRFNTIGSISFDHPDPSIFLVLQSITDTPGVDGLDFVHVSAALAGDAGYLPAALVPSQHRQ